MTRAREVKNVLEVCVGDESMQQLLPFLLEQLESCQKSLSRYAVALHPSTTAHRRVAGI